MYVEHIYRNTTVTVLVGLKKRHVESVECRLIEKRFLFESAESMYGFFCVQLKPERVTQAKEVQCAALPSSTDCFCESRNHGGAKRTSVGYPVVKKSAKLNSLRLHGTGRTHARVQDTVENDIYDRSDFASSPRGKERSRGWQSTHGNERRKVQVITDNGFVDLEEQLGISKNTKGRSRRGNSRRNGSSSRGFEEEEERLYLDGYELISVAEFDDSLDFGFGRNSFYSADELQMRQAAASPLEINKFLAEKGIVFLTLDNSREKLILSM